MNALWCHFFHPHFREDFTIEVLGLCDVDECTAHEGADYNVSTRTCLTCGRIIRSYQGRDGFWRSL